jgi:hypothetical protein
MNLKTRKRPTTHSRKKPVTRFSPGIVHLEDRATPATFYVDVAFAGANVGDPVTFNAGQAGEKTGLTFGTDAFATFNAAVTQANVTPGDDEIRIGFGTYAVDNALGPVDILDTVSIIGSGSGATLLLPTTDAGLNNGGFYTGSNSALIRIAVPGEALNVSDLIMDGGGYSIFNTFGSAGGIGSFLRYENGSTGTVNRVSSVYNIVFVDFGGGDTDATNEGAGIVATDAGTTVNVLNSSFSQYGYVGVAYQLGATGTVSGSTFTGSGAFQVTEYGVTIALGSSATISGSTFRDHTGSITPDPNFPNDKFTGAGVFVTSYDDFTDTFATATSAKLYGNTFTSNVTGIIVGQEDSNGNLDNNVSAVIRHNNIFGNDFAIDSSVDPSITVDALFNWWGDVTGPFAVGNTTPAGNNPTSTGNAVDTRVLWRDVSIQPGQGVLTSKTPLLVATSDVDYRAQLAKANVTITAVSGTPTNVSPVTFKIQFTENVSAFDLTDVTFTTAVGGTAVLRDEANNPVTAATVDDVYFLTVTGMTGKGDISVNVGASTVGGDTLPTIRTALLGGTNAAGSKATVTFDNVAPTLSGSSPTGFPVTAETSPVGFTITFSEPVTGFTASDLILGGTGLPPGGATATVTPVGDTGTVYTVSLAPTVLGQFFQRGPITVSVAAGAATDAAGNGSTVFGPTTAVNFIAPFSRGFAVGGEVGTAQPYFGVDENLATFTGIVPFEADFTGGVRVATADFNLDGTLDVVAASGVGRQTEIRVYDGKTTDLLGSRQVFEAGFTAGLFTAAGDFNNDGVPDIVVSSDVGGSSRVSIFDGTTFLANNGGAGTVTLSNFFSIQGDPNFQGGVRVAAGDVNNDGRTDLVVGAGFGGGPRVAVYDGSQLQANAAGPKLTNDYFAFSPSDAFTLTNGVFVAVGDLNGDGFGEVITGAGDGGGPRVQAYSGKDLINNTKTIVADFFASTVNGTINNRGGSRVATEDLNEDGLADIIVSPGRAGGAIVGVFITSNGNLVPVGGVRTADNTLNLFGNSIDGVFVG